MIYYKRASRNMVPAFQVSSARVYLPSIRHDSIANSTTESTDDSRRQKRTRSRDAGKSTVVKILKSHVRQAIEKFMLIYPILCTLLLARFC